MWKEKMTEEMENVWCVFVGKVVDGERILEEE